MVGALHQGGSDKRIQGVIGRIGDAQTHHGLAQVQELRNAILEFRFVLIIYIAWNQTVPLMAQCILGLSRGTDMAGPPIIPFAAVLKGLLRNSSVLMSHHCRGLLFYHCTTLTSCCPMGPPSR